MNQDVFHSIIFSIFLSSSKNSAHLHKGADSEHLISVSSNGGSYTTSCSWPLPSVSYTGLTFMNEPCNKAEILHKDYSQESNQRREEMYFQAFLTFFPLQVWTTCLSIHLRMSSRHQSLLAEIPSATSNGEISQIRRKSSAV